jgi:hypothetical protein
MRRFVRWRVGRRGTIRDGFSAHGAILKLARENQLTIRAQFFLCIHPAASSLHYLSSIPQIYMHCKTNFNLPVPQCLALTADY